MDEKSKTFASVSTQERKKLEQSLNQQIREEWGELWEQRFHDKCVAEDVARRNYDLLFVEKGTVIKATKNYKPPNLEEILKMNEQNFSIVLTQPSPKVGGWKKFSTDVLSKQTRWSYRTVGKKTEYVQEKPRNGPPKKGGRGWLHRQ